MRPLEKEATVATHVDFEFRLSRQARDQPAKVQIWVDEDHDGNMAHNELVNPLRQDGMVWRGRKAIGAESAEGVAFLVRYNASEGARWRLRVWSDQPDRHLVYEESDTVTDSAGRVIGWCRR